jgi:DNA helicase-2/ATP-dependent DNA helicase PcrA
VSIAHPEGPKPAVPAGLTPAQHEAVNAPDPLLCVLAGAGTGKTRVLTLRVARRIQDGSAFEDHVLVCTFSRKAADELRRRLWHLGVGGRVRAGTFHRTALQLLRQHRAERGGPPPTVLADRRALLAEVLGEVPGRAGGASRDKRGRRPPSGPRGSGRPGVPQLEAEIGWAKARLVAPDAYEESARTAGRRTSMPAARVADLYARYEEAKRRQRALDLDDLLWSCADLLEDDRRFSDSVRWRYRHLFVDEMQDVNPAQFRLLRALLTEAPDLFVVGDPNQSVYGWNGADPTLLDRLAVILPGTRVLRLDENHRSSPQVVTVAAAALGLPGPGSPTSSRTDGTVPRIFGHATDADEAAWVAREVWLAHRPGRRWSQLAVLARTNAQLGPVADALAGARVPWQAAGGDLGPASDVRRDPTTGSLVPADDLEGEDDEGEGTADGAEMDDPSEAESARSAPAVGRDPGDAVVLTTFHRAKGLQWPVVFVVGISEGLVPIGSARTEAAMDEERRLLYVALTRAEDELSVSWARYRDPPAAGVGTGGRRPSRWLEPMEGARAVLAAEAAPSGPEVVAAHLAGLRARLATENTDLG